jgi:protein SCO1/2
MSTTSVLRQGDERGTMRPMRMLLVIFASVIVTGCGGAADELPVLGTVPSFRLIDPRGEAFGSSELAGGTWVAGFIFTRCPDVCPAVTAQMRGLRERLGDQPASLVSISVDPLHDTPARLAEYAERHGATGNWYFLTGAREDVETLVKEGFRLAIASDGPANNPITHSDRLVLVDGERRIRGYYHGRTAAEIDRLVRDVRRLGASSGPGGHATAEPMRRFVSA